MSTSTSRSPSPELSALRIERDALGALVAALRTRGYRVVAPVVRDGYLVHEEITSAADLTPGWRDVQEPGRYRLEHDASDPTVFGCNVGPQSWKQEFFPPRLKLLRMAQAGGAWEVDAAPEEAGPPLALLGARACDVAAIAIQDRVLAEGAHPDLHYVARRNGAFIVSVDCARMQPTCFCDVRGAGPVAHRGFDLALSEKEDGFVVRVGSERGAEVMSAVPHGPADEVAEVPGGSAVDDMRTVLLEHLDSPHWDEVAKRCLSCGNCTMVCPTCFCSTVEDSSDLTGTQAERTRLWDSCFSLQHSYIHGGSVRSGTNSRYRQWITHKLATWQDQFGTSGCTGCGRCITWCPVGIDIRDEVRALQRADKEATA